MLRSTDKPVGTITVLDLEKRANLFPIGAKSKAMQPFTFSPFLNKKSSRKLISPFSFPCRTVMQFISNFLCEYCQRRRCRTAPCCIFSKQRKPLFVQRLAFAILLHCSGIVAVHHCNMTCTPCKIRVKFTETYTWHNIIYISVQFHALYKSVQCSIAGRANKGESMFAEELQ